MIMANVVKIFLIIIVVYIVQCKKTTKILKLKNFQNQGPLIFITKIFLGTGVSQIDVNYYKGSDIQSQILYDNLAIGMLSHNNYSQFTKASTCQQKSKLFYKKQKFSFRQQRQGMKHVKLYQLTQKQFWYFYLFSCQYNPQQLQKSNQQITLVFSILNNGSHFGQDQKILPAYIIIFFIWLFLIIKNAVTMTNVLTLSRPDIMKMSIFGGLILLGAAYLYRLIHLILQWSDGKGIFLFQAFYFILKNVGQAVISTSLGVISWGWSILHTKPSKYLIIIGVCSGIINTISLILSSLVQQHEELHHSYDTTPGFMALISKIVVFIIFLLGILQSIKQSSRNKLDFIKKFGLLGGFYLISHPLLVFIVELLLPAYMHYEIIVFSEEVIHITAIALVCYMISQNDSIYKKVSLNQDDSPLGMPHYQ